MQKTFKVSSLSKFIDTNGIDPNADVLRKGYAYQIRVLPEEERTVVAKISTVDVDMDGDIVWAKGCRLDRFKTNSVIFADHSYKIEDVVGKATEISIEDEGITAKIVFSDATQRARDAWELVKGGFVRANSIGFVVNKFVAKGTEAFKKFATENSIKVTDACKRIITDFELVESSICSIPCNPSALMQAISAKSINLGDKTLIALELDKFKGVDVEPKAAEVIEAEQVIDAKVQEVLKTVVIDEVIPAPIVTEKTIVTSESQVIPTSVPNDIIQETPIIPKIPHYFILTPSEEKYIKVLRYGKETLVKEMESELEALKKGRII